MTQAAPLLPLALLVLAGVAFAEDEDPPDRVARLSYVQGDVSVSDEENKDWSPAPANRPLTAGDRLWVAQQSRAELQTASASIHLDQRTGISFLDLDDYQMRISLTAGTINVRVNSLDRDEDIDIVTPNSNVSLQRIGEYRITLADDGNATIVGVRSGESAVSHDRQIFNVQSGQEGRFTGTGYLNADVRPIGPRDDFEAWADDRNRRDERSVSAQYVSPEVVGYEDLDEYGSWDSDPQYGYVWYPRTVSVGWAPYRFGHWAWVAPWGWTWVDRAPWGFAPFHYGRWAYLRSRWCWVPGPRHVRPVYAPALVAWVGGGTHIGWFPLGPREVYVPRYRTSERYVHRVNIANTTVINNTYISNVYRSRGANVRYINQRTPGAVTAVSQQDFKSARPIERHTIRVDEREATTWHARAEAPQIRPTPESFANRENSSAAAIRPPSRVMERELAIREQRTLHRETPLARPAVSSTDRPQDNPRETREIQIDRARGLQRSLENADRERQMRQERDAREALSPRPDRQTRQPESRHDVSRPEMTRERPASPPQSPPAQPQQRPQRPDRPDRPWKRDDREINK